MMELSRLQGNKTVCRTLVLLLFAILPLGALKASALPVQDVRTASAPSPGPYSLSAGFRNEADALFEANMEANHIPGAAVAIVQNGRIAFLAGYGYADLAHRTPVDPAHTPFRVASVSKALTIAAVLQLCESGQMQLEDDVNRHIEWALKNPFDEPIRIRHLLTHTDGFGTRDINTFSTTPENLRPLGELLQKELTPPVKEPGTAVVYGSFGTALAGHLVERASGMPFEKYMADYLFAPLGMERSSFAQVLPDFLAGDVATVYSYEKKEGRYVPNPYLYLHTPPTGGLTTTALDMGRFLQALLNGGAPVLGMQSAGAMFQRQFSMHPALGGITYGFMEQNAGGERVLLRDGSGLGIRAQLCLLPEQNAGYFYVQNAGGDGLLNEFNKMFLEHFAAGAESPAEELGFVDAKSYAGVYRAAAANEYTMVKFLEYLFTGNLRVSAADNGRLTITPLGLGDYLGGFESESEWVGAGPLLFKEDGHERYIAFLQDEAGRVAALASGSGYHSVYDRLSWYEAPGVQLALLGAMLLLFLSSPVLFLKMRRECANSAIPCRWLAISTPLLTLLGFSGVVYTLLIKRVAGFPAFGAGISPLATTMLILLHLGAALGLWLLPCAGRIWRRKGFSLSVRIHYTLLAAAAIGFIIWMNYWNLLGFQY